MCFFLFAVKTGSFVYDVNIGLDNWQPSQVRRRFLFVRLFVCVCVCVCMCMCAHALLCTETESI
jgi:hypothetical protein